MGQKILILDCEVPDHVTSLSLESGSIIRGLSQITIQLLQSANRLNRLPVFPGTSYGMGRLGPDQTPGQHPGPKLRDPPFSAFRKRPALVFFEIFLFLSFLSFSSPLFGFTRPLKTLGAVHFPPLTLSHWWALMSRSLILNSLEHHWRIVRQSSSPLISSQTCRRRTHAPTVKPFRPTVAALPPLMTIRHCICTVTVSCLGSDIVHSSMARLLYFQSHWH
ncbi:uncharacterized protein TNCV_3442271 [Trichonephila clavipes]|nr:uncharacterized protein TNCV_3442271 [Trichonephila clavipes]